PERPVRLPAALPRPQELVRHGLAHEGGNQSDLARLDRSARGDRRGTEKDGPPGRLLRVALEETIDHEAAQTVPHEMQSRSLELAHESLQARRDFGHAGGRGGI